ESDMLAHFESPHRGRVARTPSSSRSATRTNPAPVRVVAKRPGELTRWLRHEPRVGRRHRAPLGGTSQGLWTGRRSRERAVPAYSGPRPTDSRADPAGANAYPIATYTWMLLYEDNKDPKKAAALRQLVDFCLSDGQKMSQQMGGIPLPENVEAVVRQA